MIDKNQLLNHINELLRLAQNRQTDQGVKVYEGAIKKIGEASTQSEVDELARKVNHALFGIENHGYFTQEEQAIVTRLREMR